MGLRRPAAASTVSGPAAAFLIPHRPPWVLRFGAQYQPAPLVLINGSAKSGCLPRAGGRIAGKPPGPGLGLPLAGLRRSVSGDRPGCPGPGRRLVQSLLTPSLPSVRRRQGERLHGVAGGAPVSWPGIVVLSGR